MKHRNATGLYDIVDQKHPLWSHQAEENTPRLLNVPGFFHLISWKMLPTYNANEFGFFSELLSSWMNGEPKGRVVSNMWNILVSCHGVYLLNQRSLNYLHNEPGKLFSLETLITLLKPNIEKTESMQLCEFNRSVEYFFRRGKLPACAGGFNSYEELVNFNEKQLKSRNTAIT